MSRARSLARYAAWAVFALFLVAVFAGPVRAVLGVDLRWATLLAVAPSAVVILALAWRRAPAPLPWRALLVVVGFVLLGLALMWSRRFGPLIGWVGSDGGVHVGFRTRFIESEPGIYDGFVALYGFTWALERVLHIDAFWSFGLVFLLVTAAVCALAPAAVFRAATLTRSLGTDGRSRMAIGVSLVAALVVLIGVALPLVSYYQADGFFTQLMGLLPLLAFWWVDVSRLDLPRRGLLLVLCILLERYTYGLILGDLLVVVPVLVLLEASRATRRRGLWLLATLGAAAASTLALHRFFSTMAEVVTRYGWFIQHDYARVRLGASIATAALAVAALAAPALGRFLVVPVVIGVSNCAASYLVGRQFAGEHYYLYKYEFHAILLLCLATPAVLAFTVRAAVGWRCWLLGACVLAASLGFVEVGRGIAPMRTLFAQRAFDVKPKGEDVLQKLVIGPLVDLGAVERMRDRLQHEHAKFGGYLVSSGPMFNFVNAELGRYAGGFFDYKRLDMSPGHCVFWTTKGKGIWMWSMPRWMTGDIAFLRAQPASSCRSYRASWDPKVERDLCSVCFAPVTP